MIPSIKLWYHQIDTYDTPLCFPVIPPNELLPSPLLCQHMSSDTIKMKVSFISWLMFTQHLGTSSPSLCTPLKINIFCRRTRIIGGMEVVCEKCFVVLVNSLCFPSTLPPETKWHPLSKLQYLVTGLPWTKDYPSTTSQEQ